MQCSLYCCQNKDEVKSVIPELNQDATVSFEDEVMRCLDLNTNHVTIYVLSRVLRVTIHLWIAFDDELTGMKRLKLRQFMPPELDTLQRIEMLEIVSEPINVFCLMIPKMPPTRLVRIPNGEAEVGVSFGTKKLDNLEQPITQKVTQASQGSQTSQDDVAPSQESRKKNIAPPSRSCLRKQKSREHIKKTKTFQCDVCKMELSSQDVLIRHLTGFHKIPPHLVYTDTKTSFDFYKIRLGKTRKK